MKKGQILKLARLQAALQFAPQIGELHRQATQANDDLASGIAAQAAAARAITHSANAARRPTKRTYDSEIHSNASVNAGIASDLASIPGADKFRAAADREAALATENATSERSHALQGLTGLATGAAKGRAYAVQSLLAAHDKSIGDISSKLTEVAGEKGAAASKGYLDLLQKEESNSISRGNLNERKRHDKVIENNSGSGKNSYKSKHGGFTKAEVLSATGKARDAIREAMTWLGRGTPPAALLTGRKVAHNTPLTITGPDGKQHIVYESDGKTPKVQHMTIDVPKIAAIYIRAAKELSLQGTLSRGTVHELRTRAVHVPKSWLGPSGAAAEPRT